MADLAAAIIPLYRKHAGVWAARRANRPERLMEAGWLDRFLAILPAGRAVLDLGCGTGDPLAMALAARGCEMTGVDSSPEMLNFARRNLPQAEWIEGDMRKLSLGRAFDGLLAWDSFFHLDADDQRAIFPIFRAHAAPGAALMFTSGPARGEAIGAFEGEPLYHSSLDPDEYRELLDANGFEVVAYVAEDPECGRHTVWLARGVR